MHLKRLLFELNLPWPPEVGEELNPEVQALDYDSRRVRKGSLFFAIEGLQTDGHLYIEEALRRGAVAVASQREAPPRVVVPWIRVPAIRPFMGLVAERFYGHPSRRLQLVGITGTNGKTTTSFLLHSILEQESTALLMGTVKTSIGDWEVESERTTPESVDVQRVLEQAVESGCTTGAVEVSSHALFFYRVYQCRFPIAIFTNLSQDHLDFHGSLKEYFETKCLLFQHHYNPGLHSALLNGEDPFSGRIPLPKDVRKVIFGFSPNHDVFPVEHQTCAEGTEIQLKCLGRHLSLKSPLAGRHNAYNIMAASAAASLLGFPDEEIVQGVSRLQGVPGRFERVELPRPFTVMVDYAHTPHALENVLRACRELGPRRVLCVFGCGGERDRGKRPLMGAIAVRRSDLAILTSDNPRREDPELIVREIEAGIPSGSDNYRIVLERRKAIAEALKVAQEGDLVLIAGKGHETYQQIDGDRIHFDDREVVRELA